MLGGSNLRIVSGVASIGCLTLVGLSSGLAYAQEVPPEGDPLPRVVLPACEDEAAATTAACGLRVIKDHDVAEVVWVSETSPLHGWSIWIDGEQLADQPSAARGIYIDPARVHPGMIIGIQGHFEGVDSAVAEVTVEPHHIEDRTQPAPPPAEENVPPAPPEPPVQPVQINGEEELKVVDTLVIEPDSMSPDTVDETVSDVDENTGINLDEDDIAALKKIGIPLVAGIIGLMIIFIIFLKFLKRRRAKISYDNHPILHNKSPREVKQRLESGVYNLDDHGQPVDASSAPLMSTPHRELLDAEDFDPYKALELMTGKDPRSVEHRSQGPLLELLNRTKK